MRLQFLVVAIVLVGMSKWAFSDTPPPLKIGSEHIGEVYEGTFQGLEQIDNAYWAIVDVEVHWYPVDDESENPSPPIARARCLIGRPTKGLNLIDSGISSDDSYFTLHNMTKVPEFLEFVKRNWLDHPRFDKSKSRVGDRVSVAPTAKYCNLLEFIDD